jgi:hypothetical protein
MNYRKIWKDANGPIPVDEQGRSYDIHHIDGNRKNNLLENLMCVSIEEHYKIHLEQGDLYSANLLAKRLKIDCTTGFKGNPRSKETKAKISKAHKGKPKSEKHKQKIREYREGHKHSEETKLKIGKARKGIARSEEFKDKIRKARLGKKLPSEWVESIRQAKVRPVLDLNSKVVYASKAEACQALNWKAGKMNYRMKKGEFQYL